ncbi:MAG TPA: U32 family peptidase [Anaerolineae bacterium]|nr:U32 family peptidase [Anaerolineae bacterium]HQI86849.1 U32 family peptidase [Anaerolineae bacterium]
MIELLAPAQNLECGLAAIDAGADAVYIGAARFGARAKAGNSLADIEALAQHAHTYWARVYVTLNTLLYDDELPQAVRLAHQLYDIGVDALIIQDVGLLEGDLPPLPLIASTQMHNHTPERVAFLEAVGFRRVILARELSLAQIAAIRQATTIELETFVHGALCVSYSGQCLMSYAIGGRSGNRGECAQPCRRVYSLVDRNGAMIVKDRHLLSLRDLNLSAHLGELLDAGVTSFKIEGRLKDKTYVVNVVSAYRRALDQVLAARGLAKSSSGRSTVDFAPDLNKTFNRGYTTYFLHGRGEPPGSIDTPKMVGEWVGEVASVDRRSFRLAQSAVALHNGDGLCFFDAEGVLQGTVVNAVNGLTITPNSLEHIRKGTRIYRNHDHAYLHRLEKSQPARTIAVQFMLEESPEGFTLIAVDEDGNRASATLATGKVHAEKPELAQATVEKQLRKTGGTAFECAGVAIHWRTAYFLPVAVLNELRRAALDTLLDVRAQNRPRLTGEVLKNDVPYPEKQLTYLGNVLNRQAEAFYRRHGVTEIEPAAESGLDMRGRRVMRTRYCLLHQLGYCRREKGVPSLAEPLSLVDEDGHKYPLRFDCANCEMEVFY